MKTTRDKIKIMQAHVDGETIEQRYPGGEWHAVGYVEWDWGSCDYRVKPEPKLVPYETVDEFIAAKNAHGCHVSSKIDAKYGIEKIVWSYNFINNRIVLYDVDDKYQRAVTFKELVDDEYHWQDGTPCGKFISE